jgi:alkanesulfonate monooxygenase SsuD/methylene tetrahydromethanopterin reductase-like flavin-dependent oxidoreductase (luciferase family)
MMDRIGRERGWPPLTHDQYEASRQMRGANFVGSPSEIVDKILFQHALFNHDRFLLQMSVGTLAHADVMGAIELLGTAVAPAVRAALKPAQAAKR